MTLAPAFLDELRARTHLSSLIGRTTKLQRAGREWKACCPFHDEKTPSFTVNDAKGFYHCFGCGAHGDAIAFLMRAEGASFPEAVERLAAEAGLSASAVLRRVRRLEEAGVIASYVALVPPERVGLGLIAGARHHDPLQIARGERKGGGGGHQRV